MPLTLPSLQDVFLEKVITEKLPVTVFLVNGLKLKGELKDADTFSIVISRKKDMLLLVYKHAMATIVPDAIIQAGPTRPTVR